MGSSAADEAEQMPRPNNHLAFAIIMTVLCCVPFGIVAIVKACKVNSLYDQGLVYEAYDMADSAKKYCIISLIFGLVANTIVFVLNFLAALA